MTDINFEELAKSVGKAIGRQRHQAGLTQDQVAEHLKIGMEAVSRMERGLVVPTVVRLAELAQLFGCDPQTSCVRPAIVPPNKAW